jgi:single-stranded-DNA-specific exonuclease
MGRAQRVSFFSQRPYSSEIAKTLASGELHPLLARLYAARGVESVDELGLELKYLLPPNTLLHCEDAAKILADAIRDQRQMLIVADYDCDGATACAVGIRGLKMLGASPKQIDFLVPNRFTMGYGLTPEVIDLAKEQTPKPSLLITVDNGIASHAGIDYAKEHGMDVLVTDHHLPSEQLPNALAIVNPNQPQCGFQSKALAGVGVMFYLLIALRAELRQRGIFTTETQPKLEQLLGLVALGTVADVAQLDRNNRILVSQGLKRIRQGITPPGLLALFEVAGRNPQTANPFDLGFAVGPRLNAAGRLADMSLGIQLLLCDDPKIALEIAQELDRINRERRVIESGMQESALAHLTHLNTDERPALCLWNPNWHQGVVGIVASRLKERFNRPAIIFAPAEGVDGEALLRGSGRSIAGFHLRDALDLVSKRKPSLIQKFGGHAMAAGLTIRQADFGFFEESFLQVSRELLNDDLLQRHCIHDGELSPEELNVQTGDILMNEIWGHGFPEPLFYGEFDVLQQSLMKDKHLRLQLKPRVLDSETVGHAPVIGAVWFNRTQTLPPKARLAYRLVSDRFHAEARVQLMIEALNDQA